MFYLLPENVSGFEISVTNLFIHLVTTPGRSVMSQSLPEVLGNSTEKTTGRVVISQERGHPSGTKLGKEMRLVDLCRNFPCVEILPPGERLARR